MLSASSPIAYPSDPVSPIKRPQPHDGQRPRPKPRPGPFLDDSESEEEDAIQNEEPSAKRRRIDPPGEHGAPDTGPCPDNEGLPQLSRQGPPPSPILIEDAEEEEGDEWQVPAREAIGAVEPATTPLWTHPRSLFSSTLLSSMTRTTFNLKTCSGREIAIKQRKETAAISYESMVAARSRTKEGRAKRDYYGVDIHNLMNAAQSEIAERRSSAQAPESQDAPLRPHEAQPKPPGRRQKKVMLWTEKYRARTFTDLCGDDSTNRLVLRWLKRWDALVFPGQAKARPATVRRHAPQAQTEEEKPHRKILMLTGAPGLGKTTLAHVCARQAGYEVIEVNASDDRSKDVVKNRIRTILGTESVKSVGNQKDAAKAARPACVIVDEVDGVTSGAGASGEGGFIKALIDLVLIDQKNSSGTPASEGQRGKKKKGDDFRLMRPLILICNDVYHSSLRPLRQSNLAEIIHVGRPLLDSVVGRLKTVFEKEGIPCDKDAARKLCEAAWGMASGIDAKRGQESTVHGDLRGVMVVGEWVASRFRVSAPSASQQRLTREWIERNILAELNSGAAGARGLGRGSVRDIVGRIFQEGGGFPKQALDLSAAKPNHEQPKTELGFGEHQKKHAMECLRQMVDSSGEISHIVTEVFAEYPGREFNDDSYLSKPNKAYEWLWFHDTCQSRLFASQEWELAPYLSQPVLACHDLFASPIRHFAGTAGPGYERRGAGAGAGAGADDQAAPPQPFSGPRADYQAHEAEKHTRAQLQTLQAQLSPTMMRLFRSPEDLATEFLPYLTRMLSPDVKPVVVGGSSGSTASVRKESERAMVKRASEVLADVGITLQKGKIESDNRAPQYVYRMEPDLDALATFETASTLLSSQAPTRYAVRQVLDQELQRTVALRETLARQARYQAGRATGDDHSPLVLLDGAAAAAKKKTTGVAEDSTAAKRDFFGRIIVPKRAAEGDGAASQTAAAKEEQKVWVTYHEGLNNAVRKPMMLSDFLHGLY